MHLVVFLIGLVVGSFVNVLAIRIPEGEGIGGRSRCRSCARTLTWFELIPVLSYILQRGRCRSCRAWISIQYPLVETATAALFLALWIRIGSDPVLFGGLAAVFALLVALFVIDLRFGVLPDALTIPAIIIALATYIVDAVTIGLVLLIARDIVEFATTFILPMAIGSGFFALQWLVSRGRWVGSGDIRMGALMGAILVWPRLLIVALLVAYVSGALVALALLALGRVTRKSHIPFGPFLITGTTITFFLGQPLLDWYIQLVL